jgi:hypothetical protein
MIDIKFNEVEVSNGYGWVLGHTIPTCMYFEINNMYVVFPMFFFDS